MNLSFPAASFPFTKASWIWAPNAEPTDYAVCRFRTRLRLGEAHTLRLSVSADSRYLLYWDGRPLGRGPARSDLRHYVYETYTVELSRSNKRVIFGVNYRHDHLRKAVRPPCGLC